MSRPEERVRGTAASANQIKLYFANSSVFSCVTLVGLEMPNPAIPRESKQERGGGRFEGRCGCAGNPYFALLLCCSLVKRTIGI